MHEADEGVVELVICGGRPPPSVQLARRGDDGAGRRLSRVTHLQIEVMWVLWQLNL